MKRILDASVKLPVVVAIGMVLFLAALCYGHPHQPLCRVVDYEPTRDSTARLSVELTEPDASASQRLDCTCREWP